MKKRRSKKCGREHRAIIGCGRASTFAAPLLVMWTISLCSPVSAQEIFHDGFEWDSTCAWSNPWFPDADLDQWGDELGAGTQVSCPAPDGFVPNAGDCNDADELINPSAFDIWMSGVDENCDGQLDETAATCDAGLPSDASDAMFYPRAMDLCRTGSNNGPDWGVVGARLDLPDGSGTPSPRSHAIRPGFGAVTPQRGSSMILLSTGTAAAPGDSNPDHSPFQPGADTGTLSGLPADWLAANGGVLPNSPGCPPLSGEAGVFNGVMLTVEMRVPSNANSFSVLVKFYSADFPEWVCSPFNDGFVVLLDSTYRGDRPNPLDKNLARYTDPALIEHPIGVNLAFGDTGLFTQCLNGPTGCAADSVPGTITSCIGTGELIGTGMDVPNPPPVLLGESAWCGESNLAGGGTGWLVTRGNVVPGEEIALRIAVWDTGDGLADSSVLMDNFQWSVDSADPGTIPVDSPP